MPLLFALGLGWLGGGTFYLLDLPLPWMLGAMAVSGITSLSGWRLAGAAPAIPKPLRGGMLAVLAVMLGSSFSPALWGHVGQWGGSLAGLFAAMALSVALCMAYLRRYGGFAPVTAYFAAAPGGISEMVVTGAAMGGDERSIALIHSLRIILIVFTVPFGFRLLAGIHGPSMQDSMGTLLHLSWQDAAVLTAIAVGGTLIGRGLRFPAAVLTGPLLVSAIAHVTGWTTSRPPAELVIVAQVVTGAGLGARFVGLGWRDVAATARIALGSTVLLVVISGGAAGLLAWGTGLPFGALLLAFVPGGIAEMCLIALALGQDVAFVSTHHVLRVVMVIVAAPLLFRLCLPFWSRSP